MDIIAAELGKNIIIDMKFGLSGWSVPIKSGFHYHPIGFPRNLQVFAFLSH
jgi:hypothetical protein